MTRKKVKLMWIANDAARKASLKKRRVGLLKKVSELTTLCGVNAMAIVYGPEDDQPAVWPSPLAVEELLARFRALPELERSKKMMTQESYLKERTTKVQEQLRKHVKKNNELEMDHLMFQLIHGTQFAELQPNELVNLFWSLEEKIRDTQKRIDYFLQIPPPPGQQSEALPKTEKDGDGGTEDVGRNSNQMMDQWFVDMMMNQKDVTAGKSSTIGSEIGMASSSPFDKRAGSSNVVGSEMGLSSFGLFEEKRAGEGQLGLIQPFGSYAASLRMAENDHHFQTTNDFVFKSFGGAGTSQMGAGKGVTNQMGLFPHGVTFGGPSYSENDNINVNLNAFGGFNVGSDFDQWMPAHQHGGGGNFTALLGLPPAGIGSSGAGTSEMVNIAAREFLVTEKNADHRQAGDVGMLHPDSCKGWSHNP